MAKKQISTGNSINGLTHDDLVYFYEFLTEYERSKKGNWKYKTIPIKTLEKECGLSIKKQPSLAKLYPSGKNEVIFYNPSSIVYDLLRHIRNSFAHANVTRKNDYYHLEDYKEVGTGAQKQWKLSMSANIDCDLLKKFIDTLKAAKI
ncbi:hypothetical protein AGMMS49965_24360 [Bacteroidia bacterium]|nr:hypothetical protein AGMMS49965_24360 [Bacteroidia bacterium]